MCIFNYMFTLWQIRSQSFIHTGMYFETKFIFPNVVSVNLSIHPEYDKSINGTTEIFKCSANKTNISPKFHQQHLLVRIRLHHSLIELRALLHKDQLYLLQLHISVFSSSIILIHYLITSSQD